MRKILVGLVVIAAMCVSGAATLFGDDFSGGTGNWVKMPTPAKLGYGVASGQLWVRDSSTNSDEMGMLKHDDIFTSFTYSATMGSFGGRFGGAGILFCQTGPLGGYYVILDTLQHLTLFRTSSTSSPTSENLCYYPFSYIRRSGDNSLKVNRRGTTITLSVNGKRAVSVSDNTFTDGNIGLVVRPATTAVFDNVLVTSDVDSGAVNTCFSDDFSSSALDGWYISDARLRVSSSGGTLHFSSGAGLAAVYTNGNYSQASMKAIVTRNSGTAGNPDGIAFASVQINGTSSWRTGYLAFVINANRSWGIINPDSSTYVMTGPNSNIHGTTDTLEVICNAGTYTFMCNGHTLKSNWDPGHIFDLNAAGFYVLADLDVNADDFVVASGNSPVCPTEVTHRDFMRHARSVAFSGPAAIYDLKGRQVAIYGAIRSHANLPQGSYVVVQRNHSGCLQASRVLLDR